MNKYSPPESVSTASNARSYRRANGIMKVLQQGAIYDGKENRQRRQQTQKQTNETGIKREPMDCVQVECRFLNFSFHRGVVVIHICFCGFVDGRWHRAMGGGSNRFISNITRQRGGSDERVAQNQNQNQNHLVGTAAAVTEGMLI